MNLSMPTNNVVNVDSELMSRLQDRIPKVHRHGTLYSIRLVSVEFVHAKVELDDAGAVKLPESRYYDVYKNINCSSERRGWTETLSLTKVVTLQRSASFTKAIQSSSNISLSIPLPKVGGTAGGGASRSVTVTNQNGWSETEQVTTNTSRSINTEVAPGKALLTRLQKTVYSVRVPFKANVIVDGVVEAVYVSMQMRPSGRFPTPVLKVRKQRFLISDLLPQAERTFEVTGFVENSSADELQMLYYERDVDRATECMPQEKALSTVKANFAQDGHELDSDLLTTILVAADDARPGELVLNTEEIDELDFGLVEEEFFGSTTIRTSDSVAQVWVRHLSFGPGFCTVETRSSRGTLISTPAPPTFWSEWQTIESHFGEISLTLTATVKCDTGVRSQVRYWKKV